MGPELIEGGKVLALNMPAGSNPALARRPLAYTIARFCLLPIYLYTGYVFNVIRIYVNGYLRVRRPKRWGR